MKKILLIVLLSFNFYSCREHILTKQEYEKEHREDIDCYIITNDNRHDYIYWGNGRGQTQHYIECRECKKLNKH